MSAKTIDLSFKTPLSPDECVQAVLLYGQENTVFFEGEPGIGKSSVHRALKRIIGDTHHHVYIDGPLRDVGDVQMYVPDMDSKTLVALISEQFPRDGKPFVIMIDEWLKAPRMLQTLFTRLALERSLGDFQLPDGSYVFMTSNLASDRVGDAIAAHADDRVLKFQMRKGTAEEIINANPHLNVSLKAAAAMNPRFWESYTDGESARDNPYIFNPTTGKTRDFLTPRSFCKCHDIIEKMARAGERMTRAALAGQVGMAAAEKIMGVALLQKDIFDVTLTFTDPHNAPLPDKVGALYMMMFHAIDKLQTQDDLSNFLTWHDRAKSLELESLFFSLLMRNKRTAAVAVHNGRVKQWVKDNAAIL